MDEDVDPKHAAKSDDKGKNPFAKKALVYHTFLGTPTVRQQDPNGYSPPSSLVPALVGGSNHLGQDGAPRPYTYGEPVRHGHQPLD